MLLELQQVMLVCNSVINYRCHFHNSLLAINDVNMDCNDSCWQSTDDSQEMAHYLMTM